MMSFILFVIALYSTPSYANISVTSFPEISVDKSNLNVFSTPIAYYRNTLFTVNVETPDSSISNGVNLRTVIREISSSPNAPMKSNVIDSLTLDDKYHTQASVAVDKLGYIHVAYNMHNMPWQYAVSSKPGDISSFTFHGEAISSLDKFTVKHLNKTPFSSFGKSDIQGNQITYPSFFYDNNNDIYITYRFAAKPKKIFKDRAFSGGIAKYDSSTKTWIPFGGDISLSPGDVDLDENQRNLVYKALAYKEGWTVYLPRLAFDRNNDMHVSWLWREGIAGGDTTRPSYAYKPHEKNDFYTSKNIKYTLPITEENSDWIGSPTTDKFFAISDISVADDFVYVILQRFQGKRELYRLNRQTSQWQNLGDSPFGASIIKFDGSGGQWAFATGLTVLFRKNESAQWKIVYSDKDQRKFGYPKVLHIPENHQFFIHTQSLKENFVKIYKLEY